MRLSAIPTIKGWESRLKPDRCDSALKANLKTTTHAYLADQPLAYDFTLRCLSLSTLIISVKIFELLAPNILMILG